MSLREGLNRGHVTAPYSGHQVTQHTLHDAEGRLMETPKFTKRIRRYNLSWGYCKTARSSTPREDIVEINSGRATDSNKNTKKGKSTFQTFS